MTKFGKWLTEERKNLGLSRERLAARAGISFQTIQRAENGHEILPMSEETIARAIKIITQERKRERSKA